MIFNGSLLQDITLQPSFGGDLPSAGCSPLGWILMRCSKFCWNCRSSSVAQNLHDWSRFTTENFICGHCPKGDGADSQFDPGKVGKKVDFFFLIGFSAPLMDYLVS